MLTLEAWNDRKIYQHKNLNQTETTWKSYTIITILFCENRHQYKYKKKHAKYICCRFGCLCCFVLPLARWVICLCLWASCHRDVLFWMFVMFYGLHVVKRLSSVYLVTTEVMFFLDSLRNDIWKRNAVKLSRKIKDWFNKVSHFCVSYMIQVRNILCE